MLRSLLLFASLLLAGLGCGQAAPPPSAAPSSSPAPASTPTIIGWAVGSDTLGDYPTTADAYLLLLPKGQSVEQGTRLTSACVRATAILPAPPPSTQVFLLIDGALHILRKPGTQPEALPGLPASVHLRQLLGFRTQSTADAGKGKPWQMLAASLSDDGVDWKMWTVTLSDAAVVKAEPTTVDRTFATQEAFFAAYQAPRCLPGGTHCVGKESDGRQTYIKVESTRGAPPKTLQSLSVPNVRDVSYGPNGETLYLLIPCS